eukprot:4553376-Lingulodinium_polyedra.AAC.1
MPSQKQAEGSTSKKNTATSTRRCSTLTWQTRRMKKRGKPWKPKRHTPPTRTTRPSRIKANCNHNT